MKKLLFCAGILALAASSCTEEFDTASVQQEQAQGITFTAGDEIQNPATKGDFTVTTGEDGKEAWDPFWTAEMDRINVYATGVKKGKSSPATLNEWSAKNKVTYKATRSERFAKFTSVSDEDLLQFDGATAENPAIFLATYPEDLTVDFTNPTSITPNMEGMEFKLNFGKDLLATQAQTNTQGKGVYELNAKYDLVTAYPYSDRVEAVGENVSLNFERLLSGFVFKTENVNQYTVDNDIFGPLLSISVEMDGEYDPATNEKVANEGEEASKLLYKSDGSSATIVVDENGNHSVKALELVPADANANKAKVEMNSTSGLEWSDAARGYMVTMPVSHKDVNGHEWYEGIKVTYSFKNIDFKQLVVTKGDLERGSFARVPALDINSYDYLVTKESSGDDRTLIVNKGNFCDIYNANDATPNTNVVWEGVDVPVTEFSKIIVNEGVVLTDAELAMLKKYTNLTEITLKSNTKIPAGTFVAAQTKLKKIDFPNVTEIVSGAFDDAIALSEVYLPSYEFKNDIIARQVLRATSLVKLDMSGVDAMNVGFPSTGFTLNGYGQLTDVTVMNGVKLGANAFSNCGDLVNIKTKNKEGKLVDAVVNLNGGGVFSGCDELTSVIVGGTDVPAYSFNGCEKLAKVTYNGKDLNPTKVGNYAFKGTKIKNMALDNATEIGTSAFENCEELIGGTDDEGKIIIRVGGKTIGENAFKGCTSLQHIQLLGATTIGNGALAIDNGDLKQIQLDQAVDFSENSATPFGTDMSDVDLFINENQKGWNDKTLNWGVNGTTEFQSIRFRTED